MNMPCRAASVAGALLVLAQPANAATAQEGYPVSFERHAPPMGAAPSA